MKKKRNFINLKKKMINLFDDDEDDFFAEKNSTKEEFMKAFEKNDYNLIKRSGRNLNNSDKIELLLQSLRGIVSKDVFYHFYDHNSNEALLREILKKDLSKEEIKGFDRNQILHLLNCHKSKYNDFTNILSASILMENLDLLKICIPLSIGKNILDHLNLCLSLAIKMDNKQMIEILISNNNTIDSLLWEASIIQNLDLMEQIIKRGANVKKKTNQQNKKLKIKNKIKNKDKLF